MLDLNYFSDKEKTIYEFENRTLACDKIKQEIDSFKPLSDKLLKQIKEYYRVGLTYSSNALEGNTLTESETKVILEEGLTIGGKSLREHQEVIGHSDSFDYLYDIIKRGKDFSEEDIKKLHHLFYNRIDEFNAGIYRKENVAITGTTFIPPKHHLVPEMMANFIDLLPTLKQKLHPVELAAKIHLDFVRIHPFTDGNGRTGRLLMNLALMQSGYSITIIPPVMRHKYIETIRLADAGKKDEQHFINFISTMVYEAQKDQLRIYKEVS